MRMAGEPGRQVELATDQWATVALTGQQARRILERLNPHCDVLERGIPAFGISGNGIAGERGRIYRVSFSGELTYEINVPAQRAEAVWAALLEEGRAFWHRAFWR